MDGNNPVASSAHDCERSHRPKVDHLRRSENSEVSMSSLPVSRRRLLQAAGAGALVSAAGVGPLAAGPAAAAVVPPVRPDLGVSAYPFTLGQVRLTAGRWLDN